MKLSETDGSLLLTAMIQAQLSGDDAAVQKISELANNPEELQRIIGAQHTHHVQHPKLPKSRLKRKSR